MARYTIDQLARMVDHTNVRPNATHEDMVRLCSEAKAYHFKMVAVTALQSEVCSRELAGTDIDTGAAIAFPFGQATVATKVFETKDALANGANEIDYSINLTEVKAHDWNHVRDEMAQIVAACNEAGAISKVILETYFLTDEEIMEICNIASEVKPTFVKTSSGTVAGGATVKDVALMRKAVDPAVKVKASGGIHRADDFAAMVAAGAERIGCSQGIPIIEEFRRRMAEAGADYIEI